jgi:signal transduction histidine kinase
MRTPARLPVMGGSAVLRMAQRLRRSPDARLLETLAADRERARIAADLADGVVQGLAGTSLRLSAGVHRLRATDPESARVMATAASDLRHRIRELRSLVVTIAPSALHRQGLAASFADLASTLQRRGVTVTVDVDGIDGLDEPTETLLYRTAQEAVRCIAEQAEASAVAIRVSRRRVDGTRTDELTLTVRRDDREHAAVRTHL